MNQELRFSNAEMMPNDVIFEVALTIAFSVACRQRRPWGITSEW
jgi:hypothetical protein